MDQPNVHASLTEHSANGQQKGKEHFCNFQLKQSQPTRKGTLCIFIAHLLTHLKEK